MRPLLLVLALSLGACAEDPGEPAGDDTAADDDDASNDDDDATGDDDASVGDDDDATGDDDASVADDDDASGDDDVPAGFGSVGGVVHLRLYDGGELPVAHPVVYWTPIDEPPAPLNPRASCDCGYPANAVIGDADGRFELTDVPAGAVALVVQKGHFRRVRTLEVSADEHLAAPAEACELPVRSDPAAGDTVPRIVIGTGRFDAIEDVFAKLRMGPITPTFGFDYEAYMADPHAYGVELMLYQQPRRLEDAGLALDAPSFPALLGDHAALADHHFVFAPCAEYQTYGTLMTSDTVRANVRDYVNTGGKLYVTDYAYDLVEQVFPQYLDFAAPEGEDGNADGHVGDPDYMGIAAWGTLRYESENFAVNPDLKDWLFALGESTDGTFATEGNWINLDGVGTVPQCCDGSGAWVDVTPETVTSGPNGVDDFFDGFGPSHDTWTEAALVGAVFPHTVRFTYGCGEVMYSTYHTVESSQALAYLAPQELVLLYMVLEINQCNLNPIKADEEGPSR